jgi:hypothetical protein
MLDTLKILDYEFDTHPEVDPVLPKVSGKLPIANLLSCIHQVIELLDCKSGLISVHRENSLLRVRAQMRFCSRHFTFHHDVPLRNWHELPNLMTENIARVLYEDLTRLIENKPSQVIDKTAS